MMRKIFVILFALLCAQVARADEKSAKILADMAAAFKVMPCYEVVFTADLSDGQSVSGSYVVNGQKYYMDLVGAEVFCDGKTTYEVNIEDKVVNVSSFDPSSRSLFSNPTKAFEFMDGAFTHTLKGSTKRNGVECYEVVLTPRDKGSVMDGVIVLVNKTSSLPVALCYDAGEGSLIWVDIKSVKKTQPADKSRFTIDKKKYKGYEFIDFR